MQAGSSYLHRLNSAQLQAVEQTEGPMLILAGAGSGKTRTITCKIAHLIETGRCKPESILAVTFTNKAAEEMKQRVLSLIPTAEATPLISTFHSFAVRVLRRHAHRIGYGLDFTICDSDDQKSLLRSICRDMNLTENELPIRRVAGTLSRVKNRGWNPLRYATLSEDYDREILAEVFTRYQRQLGRSNGMDFDDLLLNTVRLFADHSEVRESYGRFFQYLLIDEYQDTNPPQYDLIRHLACLHQNISAVGDEDQSIYGFRGADIGNILRFERDFPGARVVKLEQNYRSTQTILDAATAVVSNNVQRKGKVLWTDNGGGEKIELYVAMDAREEARQVSYWIYQHLQRGDNQIAVLYRTNFQSRQIEEALRRLRVSYRLVGSLSFYSRKEIKDALAYLRLIRNPQDTISLLRVINDPPRGIGKVTLDGLLERAGKREISLWNALRESLQEQVFSGRSHLALSRFQEAVEEGRRLVELPLHLCLERVLEHFGYLEVLRADDSVEAQERLLNLQELLGLAREYSGEKKDLQEFLDHAALYSDADDYDASADVTLMTLHNAKGLEFNVVFLVGCEEGLFPHSRSVEEDDLEEERRLCYVGLTRARRKLYLSYSKSRRFYGSEGQEMNKPSRFLMEIPSQLIRSHAPAPTSRPSPPSLTAFPVKPFAGKTYNSKESVQQFIDSRKPQSGSSGGFVAGARIQHDQFGKGKILQVQPSGDDLKITVQFPGIGIKKLLQSYARMKLI